jgi:hypothetical protein
VENEDFSFFAFDLLDEPFGWWSVKANNVIKVSARF